MSTAAEAAAVSALGIDHVGVLVGDGSFPREQSPAAAMEIGAAIAGGAKLSALFLSPDVAYIARIARALRPDIVHLGAAPELLGPEHVRDLRRLSPDPLIMRSVPVTGPESIAVARSYGGLVDFLLLDSHRPHDRQIGALGITHDWNISRRIVEEVGTRVILAGGLGPDNVAEAIRAVRPAGVDSKTKTDIAATHVKDLEKVRQFHLAAKAAARG